MRSVKNIKNRKIFEISYRGYKKEDALQVAKIYAQLNNGTRFAGLKSFLYAFIGNRCLLVATHANEVVGEVIIGMNMYYLNSRDVREKTIHEGFIGVIPSMTGKGIASAMRSIAKDHFKAAGFKGISTRISLNNAPSLQSAKKMGFTPVEEYTEPSTGERRYYMVAKLIETHAKQ